MADHQSKTEQATPRQRKRARERGQVARSRELSGALTMIAVAGTLYLTSHNAAPQWTRFFRNVLDSAHSDSIEPNGPLLFWTSIEAMRWIFPILGVSLGVAVLASVAQGGFTFAPEALAPKFDRINPAQRLSQLVSLTALSTILKSFLPFSAIAWIGYAAVSDHWGAILNSSFTDSRRFAGMAGGIVLEIGWKSGLVLLAWSGVDFLLIWQKNESDLKMSREDIKDEIKESEGNPQSKSRIRRLQRQVRKRQMMKSAETATVVITNPTHYAVALRYEASLLAPIVVAKGLDLLAARIKEIAWKFDIPIMENRALAQALYKSVEVGDQIPSALYHAVAEILVLVYRAQAEVRAREAQRRASMNLREAKPQ